MAFGFLKKAFKSVGKVASAVGNAAGSVTKNPLFKTVVGGIAVVFPPVGVPLAAGVAVANTVVKAVNSANPAVRTEAKAAVQQTLKLAAKGDVGARNAATLFNKRAAAMRAAGKFQMNGRTGRLSRRA
jgi:hypothetical protein